MCCYLSPSGTDYGTVTLLRLRFTFPTFNVSRYSVTSIVKYCKVATLKQQDIYTEHITCRKSIGTGTLRTWDGWGRGISVMSKGIESRGKNKKKYFRTL